MAIYMYLSAPSHVSGSMSALESDVQATCILNSTMARIHKVNRFNRFKLLVSGSSLCLLHVGQYVVHLPDSLCNPANPFLQD